jgi:hypothetical protein
VKLGKCPGAKRGEREAVGEEHGIQQPTFGDRGRGHDVLQADRVALVEVMHPPAGLVIAVGRHEDNERGVLRGGHGALRRG